MKQLWHDRQAKRGFTLVELIVVLVILAILAAILIPSLSGYVDKAQEKTADQQFRLMRLAIKAAAAEVDLTKVQQMTIVPEGYPDPGISGEGQKMADLIRSYLDPDMAGAYYIAISRMSGTEDIDSLIKNGYLAYYPNGTRGDYYTYIDGVIELVKYKG